MLKRLFDLAFTLPVLVLISPLLLAIAVAVAVLLGRPVLFRQTRPGVGGRPFRMTKFRTMTDERDEQGQLLADDKRLTRFGRFLRATSLDELPELFNVLKGDMSLVGPRPLLMEYLPLYSPEQFRRHEVRPGITGWAQVNGRNALSWDEKFRLDAWYVDNRSLWLDVRILLLTVRKVMAREGISADGEATMSKFKGNEDLDSQGKTEALIAIYGASGFGREIAPLVRAQLKDERVKLVFVDDGPVSGDFSEFPVWTYQEFLDAPVAKKKFVLAIANSQVRASLAQKCISDGIHPHTVAADTSISLQRITLGEGAILCHFTHLTSDIRVGKYFHANIYSYVAHDCVIGDYVTFAPAVRCNGNVVIEDHVYVGTGAIIRQGTPDKPIVIGEGAVIGMGAVVTKDVPPKVTVVGNPARLFKSDKS